MKSFYFLRTFLIDFICHSLLLERIFLLSGRMPRSRGLEKETNYCLEVTKSADKAVSNRMKISQAAGEYNIPRTTLIKRPCEAR